MINIAQSARLMAPLSLWKEAFSDSSEKSHASSFQNKASAYGTRHGKRFALFVSARACSKIRVTIPEPGSPFITKTPIFSISDKSRLLQASQTSQSLSEKRRNPCESDARNNAL